MSYLTVESSSRESYFSSSQWDVYRRPYGSTLHSPDLSNLDDTPTSWMNTSMSDGRYTTPPPRPYTTSTPRSDEYTRAPSWPLTTPPSTPNGIRASSPSWADRYSDLPRFQNTPGSRASSLDHYYRGPSAPRYEDPVQMATTPPQPVRRPVFEDVHGLGAKVPATTPHSPYSPSYRAASPVPSGLIPPQNPADQGKYTIVFDLDETLVYARSGPIKVRPGAQQVLRTAGQVGEAVMWTAGERGYAMNALRQIDTSGSVRHSVCRDGRWFSGDGVKELRKLGRDMSKTLIVENTPDCIRNNADNAILVPDFTGSQCTGVLQALDQVLQDMAKSGKSVPEYLASSSLVHRRRVPCSNGQTITAYVVAGHDPMADPFHYPAPPRTPPGPQYPSNVFSSSWVARY